MYRGSTFLLQKDYKILIPVVEAIFEKKFLHNNKIQELIQNKNDIFYLKRTIKKYFSDKYNYSVTDTLTTKIIMGTLGCTPAYDRYFISGIRSNKIASGSFTKKSFNNLIKLYSDNQNKLEDFRKELTKHYEKYGIDYPQMKLLDLFFWNEGFQNRR